MPGLLSASRVVVVGLGLMGGSLAMALHGKCVALVGVDPDPRAVLAASRRGIVEQASINPAELLPGADLIVLAAPVRAILAFLAELPRLHPGAAVVLDLGSTKRSILAAMETLPVRFDPLGGHPMAGREKNGVAHASADLFDGSPFALTALPRTSSHAAALAEELALAVGGRPLWLDAKQHDRYTAVTSHLPYLLASALASAAPAEAALLVGPGFRSTTRLAGSSPEMMLDILRTNRDNVLAALETFQGRLDTLVALLRQENWEALRTELDCGAAARERMVNANGGGK